MDGTATTEQPPEAPPPLPLAFTLPIFVMVGSVILWVFLRWAQRGAAGGGRPPDDGDER
jgi:hypothetical protein